MLVIAALRRRVTVSMPAATSSACARRQSAFRQIFIARACYLNGYMHKAPLFERKAALRAVIRRGRACQIAWRLFLPILALRLDLGGLQEPMPASCRLARMIGDWYLRKIEKQPNEVQTV